jgi:hypothetical protein
MVVGGLDQHIDFLVDDQDRLAGPFDGRETAPDFLADQRRQTFGRPVEYKESQS